jgi:hypothetical protein
MDMTRRLGRIGTTLLPIAILGVIFKYLHPVNEILHGIEGWGARKIALTLFISFFAIWSLLYVGSVFFVRITNWVWDGKNSNINKNINYSNSNQTVASKNNVKHQKSKEREALFKLDLRNENAA